MHFILCILYVKYSIVCDHREDTEDQRIQNRKEAPGSERSETRKDSERARGGYTMMKGGMRGSEGGGAPARMIIHHHVPLWLLAHSRPAYYKLIVGMCDSR